MMSRLLDSNHFRVKCGSQEMHPVNLWVISIQTFSQCWIGASPTMLRFASTVREVLLLRSYYLSILRREILLSASKDDTSILRRGRRRSRRVMQRLHQLWE